MLTGAEGIGPEIPELNKYQCGTCSMHSLEGARHLPVMCWARYRRPATATRPSLAGREVESL